MTLAMLASALDDGTNSATDPITIEITLLEAAQLNMEIQQALGNRPAPGGSFGWALAQLEAGQAVQRIGWNGKGMCLKLQVPDERSKMTLPYVYLEYPAGSVYPNGARVPWLASQTDVLTNDWVLFESGSR